MCWHGYWITWRLERCRWHVELQAAAMSPKGFRQKNGGKGIRSLDPNANFAGFGNSDAADDDDDDNDDDDHHDDAAADDDKYIDSKRSLFQPAMLAYQGVYPCVGYLPLPAMLVYQRVVYLSELSHRFHGF